MDTFAVLSSVILHEMGHLFSALLLGKHLRGIKIMPTGINLSLSAASSYAEEFLIAAAGPLMNLLYAAFAVCFPIALATAVRETSFVLAFLNLLPLFPLDGGRMFVAALSFFFGAEIGEKISSFFSLLFLSFLWILSLYIFFYSGVNFMLLLFCAYLFSYIVLKKL